MALYLGETGENTTEWFAAMYPLALREDIGVNVWPWKKMDTDSSPCSVKPPEGWDWITGFTRGGDRPSYARAQAIFDEYLENIRFENCEWKPAVIPSITRSPGCVFRAADYTAAGGDVSRIDVEGKPAAKWEDTRVRFGAGGSAVYDLYADGAGGILSFRSDFGPSSAVEISADGETLLRTTVAGEREVRLAIPLTRAGKVTVRCVKGGFTLSRIGWEEQ